jgi:hypothetical protein
MYCSKCGNQVPDGHPFCSKCGFAVATGSTGTAAAVAPATASGTPVRSAEKKEGISPMRIIGVLALVAVIGLFIFAAVNQNSHSTTSQPPPPLAAPPRPVIKHWTVKLGSENVIIEPGRYQYVQFATSSDMQAIKIVGHVEATGGSGNDVEVFVMDEDTFVNWKNHHQTAALFQSGRVTATSLELDLPSAENRYYLIFNNGFSLLSNKAVVSSVVLKYDKLM